MDDNTENAAGAPVETTEPQVGDLMYGDGHGLAEPAPEQAEAVKAPAAEPASGMPIEPARGEGCFTSGVAAALAQRPSPMQTMAGTPEERIFGMTFSGALHALKAGHRLARSGWNGKGMFVFLVPGSTFQVNREPLLSILGAGVEVDYHAHIDMKTAQGYVVPWLASQADILAGDWLILDDSGQAEARQVQDAAA